MGDSHAAAAAAAAAAAVAGYAARDPHPALRELVTSYHGYRYDADQPRVHHGLPSTALTVVLALDRPLDVGWLGDVASRGVRWLTASGLSVSPAAIYESGPQHGVTMDVTPAGARAFFGSPAAPLRDRLLDLDDLIGPRTAALYEPVATAAATAAAQGWAGVFDALDRALLALASTHADPRTHEDATLSQAWRRLHETGGRLPIAGLAREVGWSRRRLTQRFTDEYGVRPKQVARLVRFNRARDLVAASRHPLAAVAAECGYADQAHFTREWRELSGLTPTGWLAMESPNVQDRQASA